MTMGGMYHSNGNVANAPTSDGVYYNYYANKNGWIVTLIARSCSDASTYASLNTTADGTTWVNNGWHKLVSENTTARFTDTILAYANNGYSRMFKNHSADVDYGTALCDYDSSAKAMELLLQGANQKAYLNYNGTLKEIATKDSLDNVSATANAAYGLANRVKNVPINDTNGISTVFQSLSNGDVAFGYSWSRTSDTHPNDTIGDYHFYEFYRGANDYGIVKVYAATHGMWIGRWDTTNGIIWLHDVVTQADYTLSGTTLYINT